MPVHIKKRGELLNVQEAAEILEVIPRRVRQFIKDGRLPAQKIGRPWFIRRADLEKFKEVKRKTGPPFGIKRKKKTE